MKIYEVNLEDHNSFVKSLFKTRGFDSLECAHISRNCASAALHGIRSHNVIKAFHLEEKFGSKIGGCIPGAVVEKTKKSPVMQHWNAQKKIGPSVAYEAVEACMGMASEYGIGIITVDNAWHYFWGGDYVIEMANKGFIGYTMCTSLLAEVVPFGGVLPTIGTNPHSWAFPTKEIIGFPLLIDWATSKTAMGKIQNYERMGKPIPPDTALDKNGVVTTDPKKVNALLPFGEHKGYGLGLINEIMGGYIGGNIPTARGRYNLQEDIKKSTTFYFQAIAPNFLNEEKETLKNINENLKLIIKDILKENNERCMLPGEPEAKHAEECRRRDCLLFTNNEVEEFNKLSKINGINKLDIIN